MILVTTAAEAIAAIHDLQNQLGRSPELAQRLGLVHAFYIDEIDEGRSFFGFSKYIGYKGLDAATYLRDYKALDGLNTEKALDPFFEELRQGSPHYRIQHQRLTDWLATFGKTPRQGVRLMVLRPEHRPQPEAGTDRRLLDLVLAVADLLPTDQRHELRMRL